MSEKCTIFAGGEPVSFKTLDMGFISHSVIYGADKGYYLAKKLGIECDVVLGDFDSSEKPEREDILLFPIEKDDTDLMLAVRHALEHGCKSFEIYGALGGRADHLFGNIQTLGFVKSHGGSAVMIGDNDRITLLSPGKYHFKKTDGYSLSLFAYSHIVRGLTISGTKYDAADITLEYTFPLGISNKILNEQGADVTFDSGLLLVIESRR